MNKYAIIKEVGAGSFGKAILVKDVNNQEFIIKQIDITGMTQKEKNDAINEVKLLSQCKHPYIISYRESFIEQGKLCIVMDYADGGDLSRRIKAQRAIGKPFTEEQVTRWFTQALLALRYMHQKHILHRDLKTQNFFLMKSGRLRVGDFGIAKVLESTVAFAKTQIGTPYYLSPEICKAQSYSYASDIWALGCVLYELAALNVPFDAPNIKGLVSKIAGGVSAPPLPAAYSPALRQLCNSMLNKNWQERPTAEDICKEKIIQDAIKKMLEEDKSMKLTGEGASGDSTPLSAGLQPKPQVVKSPGSPTPPSPSAKEVRKEAPKGIGKVFNIIGSPRK